MHPVGICHLLPARLTLRLSPPMRRLQLYPDRMYGFWPEALPASDAVAMPSFANDVRFEVGGMVREGEEFHRLVLRYTVAGHAESLTHEVYRRV